MHQEHDAAAIMGGLYGDGIIGLKGAFSPDWADAMHENILALFEEARAVPGGALPRGPQRWYVEVHPKRVRGFVDIATHPWFVAVQFHPEFQSRPLKPHPLFASFVEAARHHKAGADHTAGVRVSKTDS